MAKTKISEFSSTAGNNTDIDSINIAEGCAPSGINNAIRELMAQLKDFQTGAAGDSFNGPVGTTTAAAGAFTTLSASGTTTLSGLTASTALALDASKNVVSVTNTGTGNNVLATSPTLVTPILGTPTSVTLTNATGLPISTGVSGLGTGIATALAVNVGSAGAPVINGGALGTPSSGTVTNLTGTASININGTVGATTANTGAFTTLTTSSTVTHNGGTANGVAYLNGSKVLTTGSALEFDGTNFSLGGGGYIRTASAGEIRAYNSANTRYGRFATISDGTIVESFNGSNEPLILSAPQAGAPIQFKIGGSEQMRLTSTGLGIGTSSPENKITLVKNTTAATENTYGISVQSVTTNGYTELLLGASDAVDAGIIQTAAKNTNFTGKNLALQPQGGNVGIGTSSPAAKLHVDNGSGCRLYVGLSNNIYEQAYDHIWQTLSGASTKMTLDSSGNLGLAVTPSANWPSAVKAAQINGSAVANNNGTTAWMSGLTWDASYNYKYSVSNFAGAIVFNPGGGGGWAFLNAPSGTAGNTATTTQALTLTANGSQLLGTTVEPTNRKSGNTYQAINSAVIEGTPYTTVSTTPVQLSRPSGVGLIAMISGYNISGGLQGTWLVLVGNGVAVVVSSSDGTATTPTFAVSAGALTMQTTTGTLSVVCQIFTGA